MTIERKLITADELLLMPDEGRRYELIRGVLVELMPAGIPHGIVLIRIAHLLFAWVEAHGNYGVVLGGDVGFWLERDPDTVRAPDVAWIAPGRLPDDAQGFGSLAPDLAVEVKSPSNSRRELAEKASMWLNFGSREVWVADPETATIIVHRPGAGPTTLGEDDTLDGGDLLPGFTAPVGYFFRR